MTDLLQYKLVNTRKSRPGWAMNDHTLMLKCVGKRAALRFQIAQMYWQKNMTSTDIASFLDMKPSAVRMVISRLQIE